RVVGAGEWNSGCRRHGRRKLAGLPGEVSCLESSTRMIRRGVQSLKEGFARLSGSEKAVVALAASTAFTVMLALSSYTLNWTHLEIYTFVTPAALRESGGVQSRLMQAFDWIGLDGYERPRFLSNLCNLVSARARLAFSNVLPP